MAVQSATSAFVHVNGIDLHYLEQGSGPPLVLIHGGSASNHEVWDQFHWGWNAYIPELAESFHVLAPDIRGHGWTRNSAGAVSYDQLSDDLAAFLRALQIEKPVVIGFSDGGIYASALSIREPDRLKAVVNIAGYDLFDPDAPTFPTLRRGMGGSDDATEPDLDAVAAEGGPWFEALRASHDVEQGEGAWRSVLSDAFSRWTRHAGYALNDLRSVTAPTLIMAGDRDHYCSPEESVRAHRLIAGSQLAIMPNLGHTIAPEMVATARKFIAGLD